MKGFAEAMGLSVEASNNEDAPEGKRGACFTLRIPQRLIILDLPDRDAP